MPKTFTPEKEKRLFAIRQISTGKFVKRESNIYYTRIVENPSCYNSKKTVKGVGEQAVKEGLVKGNDWEIVEYRVTLEEVVDPSKPKHLTKAESVRIARKVIGETYFEAIIDSTEFKRILKISEMLEPVEVKSSFHVISHYHEIEGEMYELCWDISAEGGTKNPFFIGIKKSYNWDEKLKT